MADEKSMHDFVDEQIKDWTQPFKDAVGTAAQYDSDSRAARMRQFAAGAKKAIEDAQIMARVKADFATADQRGRAAEQEANATQQKAWKSLLENQETPNPLDKLCR